MPGQTVTVSVLADTRDFSRGMQRLGQTATGPLERLRSLAASAGGALAGLGLAGGGIAVGTALAGAVRAASDLEQSMGGLEAVFQGQSAAMHRFAADAAESAGLSRDAYNQLATGIGTTLKASGTPLEQLGGRTNELITLSADLAATFGGPVTESAGAMAAALRGEFEPLRRYGVSLSAAAIETRALADTGKTSAAALTEQEKALATQALILDRTADAQGRFSAESNTLAGQTERLKAQVANLGAQAGGVLLPVLTNLATSANNALPALAGVAATLDRWKVPIGIIAGLIAAVFLPHLIALGVTATVSAAKQAAAWATTQAGAIRAAAAHSLTVVRMVAGWVLMGTQALIQAARMAAAWFIALGPIGWVIAAVIGLAALVIANWDKITAWTKTAWTNVTRWLSDAWATIKTTASAVWDGILAFFRGIPARIVDIFLRFTLPGLLIRHWDSIRTGAVNAWTAVVDYIRGIPGRLVSALGDLGSLLTGAGRRVIDSLLSGITGGFQRVRDTLGRLTDLLPDWKGPASRDRNILAGAGANVIEGFVRSLRSRFGRVRSTLSDLTDLVGGTAMPALAGPGLLGAPTPAAGGGRVSEPRAYHVSVNALTPTPEVGRVVVSAIRDFERANGAGR